MARTRRRSAKVDDLFRVVATALGKWSAECRTLLDVSQMAVAEEVGISQGGISRAENGKCQEIPLKTYLALAWYYRMKGEAAGIDLPEPAILLQAPAAVQVSVLDPARLAILHQFNDCTPRQRVLVWEVLRVLLDGLKTIQTPASRLVPQPLRDYAAGQLPADVSVALGMLSG